MGGLPGLSALCWGGGASTTGLMVIVARAYGEGKAHEDGQEWSSCITVSLLLLLLLRTELVRWGGGEWMTHEVRRERGGL